MFSYCCVMMNYKLLLLLLLICPIASKANNIKARKRPLLDHLTPTAHPLVDQIALATNWKTPNRVISATYSSHPDTGRVNHANLVVRVLPQDAHREMVDMAASETLSSSKTAAEYVSKAVHMRHKLHDKAPHSSYAKYDVYEKEQPQMVMPTQLEMPIRYRFTQDEAIPRISKAYHHEEYENYPQPGPSNRRPTSSSISMRHHHEDEEPETSYRVPNTNPYASRYNHEEGTLHTVRSVTPGNDVLRHIQDSVLKYMKEKEVEETLSKMPKVRASPVHEIKTYYRIPPDMDTGSIYKEMQNRGKVYADNMDPYADDEYVARPTNSHKGSSTKITYTTARPYSDESYTTESKAPHIDLTFRSKGRPKPIDLSALDVGQSWIHGSSLDTSGKGYAEYEQAQSIQSAHVTNPKLHFNSQSYHDINSLSHIKGKSPETYPDDYIPGSYPKAVKINDNMASVGASISVGKHHVDTAEESLKDLQKHYSRPLHIINGVPVSNPYKLNMETLKEMFSTVSAAVPNNEFNGDPENWHPYHIPTSATHHHYDSELSSKHKEPPMKMHHHYDDLYPAKLLNEEEFDTAKYKNTNGWEPLNHRPVKSSSGVSGGHKSLHKPVFDMHTSSSSNKSKKIPKGSGGGGGGGGGGTTAIRIKGGKVKIKKSKSPKAGFAVKKGRELDRELRPPPYK